MPIFELETVNALPPERRRLVPSEIDRSMLDVGDLARLAVLVDGCQFIAPWVQVIQYSTLRGHYHGIVGGWMNSEDWKPYGSVVRFRPENVIACVHRE